MVPKSFAHALVLDISEKSFIENKRTTICKDMFRHAYTIIRMTSDTCNKYKIHNMNKLFTIRRNALQNSET